MVDHKKLLEEKLREAACFGDLETVQSLLLKGVDVNSRNDMNGWTALHWAAHRNLYDVANLLVINGADKSCLSFKGESPSSLTRNKKIQILLTGAPCDAEPPTLPITPNYLRDPPLYVSENITPKHNVVPIVPYTPHAEELVLKLRIADSQDPDFIEIELPKYELTFANLTEICCKELNITQNTISKIRKLPNTVLRKDKDVCRLKDYQELEIVLVKPDEFSNVNLHLPNSSSESSSSVNGNQYESISLKKNQTILY